MLHSAFLKRASLKKTRRTRVSAVKLNHSSKDVCMYYDVNTDQSVSYQAIECVNVSVGAEGCGASQFN